MNYDLFFKPIHKNKFDESLTRAFNHFTKKHWLLVYTMAVVESMDMQEVTGLMEAVLNWWGRDLWKVVF